MGLAAARPSLFRAVVLNDIGPELGSGGTEFVRRFIGHDAAFRDIDTAAAHLRAVCRRFRWTVTRHGAR